MEPPRARIGDRGLFPRLAADVYLNHAAISPASMPVVEAVRRRLDDYAARGMAALHDAMEQRERLKGRLARMLSVEPTSLAFVPNTTSGLSYAAQSIPWRRGDRVLLFDGEFPANVTPWQAAAAQHGVEPVLLPLDGFGDGSGRGLERVERELARGAAAVAVSAVQFQTGLRMPLRRLGELCSRAGAWLCVDGIQAVGAEPFDADGLGVDVLSVGSHKWLMGPEGCAALYVRPERLAQLTGAVAGWLSHADGLRFLFEGRGLLRYDRPLRGDAGRFELGAASALTLAGWDASVELLEQLDPAAVRAHLQAWHDRVEPGLLDRAFRSLRAADPEARSAILSVELPAGVDGPALVAELGRLGVACTLPDGRLRLAPHWPNSLDEPPNVLAALDEALPRSRSEAASR